MNRISALRLVASKAAYIDEVARTVRDRTLYLDNHEIIENVERIRKGCDQILEYLEEASDVSD